MAIKVSGTTVIDDSRGLTNIATVDATTAAAIGAAGVGGGGAADFTATGTISNGNVVALRSDGTVEVVALSSSATPTAQSATEYTANYPEYQYAVFDSTNNKVIVVYNDANNANYGTAVCGTVSGTTITFGTPVVFLSLNINVGAMVYDSAQDRAVVFWKKRATDDEVYITGIYSDGTNSISADNWTGNIQINANLGSYCAAYDSNAGKTVFACETGGPSMTAWVVTVTAGTSIDISGQGSLATVAHGDTIIANNTENCVMTYDSNAQKVVAIFSNTSQALFAIVGTVSGTSTSWGSANNFVTTAMSYPNIAFDSNSNKILYVYTDGGNSNYGTARVGTVSGTSITMSSAVVYNSKTTQMTGLAFDDSTNRFMVVYRDNNLDGGAKFATISGSTVSFGGETIFETANYVNVNQGGLVYDTNSDVFVTIYRDTDSDGKAYTLTGTTSSNDRWIGIAAQDISDGATGSINIIGGINEGQTGLTVNTVYYAGTTGSLTTSDTGYKVGRAVATDKILITEGNA